MLSASLFAALLGRMHASSQRNSEQRSPKSNAGSTPFQLYARLHCPRGASRLATKIQVCRNYTTTQGSCARPEVQNVYHVSSSLRGMNFFQRQQIARAKHRISGHFSDVLDQATSYLTLVNQIEILPHLSRL
jgi:hypothetical protein